MNAKTTVFSGQGIWLLLVLLLAACSKESVTPKKRFDLLTSGSWKVPELNPDYRYRFAPDSTLMFSNLQRKSEVQYQWGFRNDEKELVFKNGTIQDWFDIESLTANRMILVEHIAHQQRMVFSRP